MQKISPTTFTAILISFFFLTFYSGFSQERGFKKSAINKNGSTLKIKHQANEKLNSRATVSLSDIQKKNSNAAYNKGEVDTLNFPLAGEYSFYLSDDGGYVSGNNSYNDKAKAEYFSIDETKKITGILIDFVVATGDSDIELVIWDNSGNDGSPGLEIYNTDISINQIINDVQSELATFVGFDNPVIVNDNFYAGVKLPTAVGDTIAIWTNSDGDSNPATAWDQWSDNSWYAYDHQDSWQLSIAHAIFPIVDNEIGLLADFTSNSTIIQTGQSIEFSDNSAGNPVSWEWTFEGGDPATSEEQNPVVYYNEVGLFDVTLKINDGVDSDSITKEDYIVVNEELVPQIDTLNYPLEGNFGLYVYNPPESGYVTGTNSYYDLAKANYFYNDVELKIMGMLVDFAVAEGNSNDIEFFIWNNNGIGNIPNTELGSKSVSFSTIIDDVTNEQLTYVEFDSPIIINHSFYAGLELPLNPSDVVAIWSNTDGDTSPGTAWELWSNPIEWHALSEPPAVEINLALGIHPIVDYNVGIRNTFEVNNLNIYPNPTNGLSYIDTRDFKNNSVVEVYDLAGILVYKSLLNLYDQDYKIDLTGFESGMYILKIKSDQGTFFNKVIKN